MSVPVPVEELSVTVARYGPAAYLLTTGDDGRPHATNAVVSVHGAELRCGVGRRTARNGAARTLVSMLWPPDEPGGYSLIVDGEIRIEGEPGADGTVGVITATSAVLHRPASAPGTDPADEAACGSDCLEIEIPE